jgi:hypothetical protein
MLVLRLLTLMNLQFKRFTWVVVFHITLASSWCDGQIPLKANLISPNQAIDSCSLVHIKGAFIDRFDVAPSQLDLMIEKKYLRGEQGDMDRYRDMAGISAAYENPIENVCSGEMYWYYDQKNQEVKHISFYRECEYELYPQFRENFGSQEWKPLSLSVDTTRCLNAILAEIILTTNYSDE